MMCSALFVYEFELSNTTLRKHVFLELFSSVNLHIIDILSNIIVGISKQFIGSSLKEAQGINEHE
jgi:hypothetical protein